MKVRVCFGFVLGFGLLLGFFLPSNVGAQSSEPRVVWSATLKLQPLDGPFNLPDVPSNLPDNGSRWERLGCLHNSEHKASRCSTATTLSDNDFVYEGENYTITFISLSNIYFIQILNDDGNEVSHLSELTFKIHDGSSFISVPNTHWGVPEGYSKLGIGLLIGPALAEDRIYTRRAGDVVRLSLVLESGGGSASSASFDPGFLDTGFGVDGKFVLPFGGGDSEAGGVGVRSGGEILVAGSVPGESGLDVGLVQLSADGGLDPGFGVGGQVVSSVGVGDDVAAGLVLDSFGKAVVAGSSFDGVRDVLMLLRYNVDGTLDDSFGSGGKVLLGVGDGNVSVSSVTIDADGRILVGGTIWVDEAKREDFVLARFGADGTLDASFGVLGEGGVRSGMTFIDFGDTSDTLAALVFDSSGGVVAVGKSSDNDISYMSVARLDSDGELHSSFSGDGRVSFGLDAASTNSHAFGVAVNNDDSVLVGGFESILVGDFERYRRKISRVGLVRLSADGSLDASFGFGGRAIAEFGNSSGSGSNAVRYALLESADAMLVQSDGKILIAGAQASRKFSPQGRRIGNPLVSLVRFNGDGTLDKTFGFRVFFSDGHNSEGPLFRWLNDFEGRALALAVTTDKVIAAGFNAIGNDKHLAVARYIGLPPASPDAFLEGLSLSTSSDGATFVAPATLVDEFVPSDTTVSVLLDQSVTHVKVTPTLNDTNATVTVNGRSTLNRTASAVIPVTIGTTSIEVAVTSEDAATTRVYTINFAQQTQETKPNLSSDASLANLDLSAGTLSTAFVSNIFQYTASAPHDISEIELTATVNQLGSAVSINGSILDTFLDCEKPCCQSGCWAGFHPYGYRQVVDPKLVAGRVVLDVGLNIFEVNVLAEDGVTLSIYRVAVTREATVKPVLNSVSSDARLEGLVLSPSVSGFNFVPDTFSYRILVPHYVTRLRTVPVANHPNANVAVDRVPVASGTLSGFKELSVGSNQLVVTVVAEDGSLSETYSLTVVRGTNNGPVFDEGSNIVRTVTEKVWGEHWWSGQKWDRPVYLQKPILADRITATDPDGDRIVYGLKDNDDEIFAIDENTGELYVKRVPKSYPLGDFETEPNAATVTVTALDPTGSGVATETSVTINIADSGTDLSLKSIEFSDFSLIRGFRSDVTHHVTVVPYETTQTTLTAEPTDPEAWLRLVAYNIDVYGNKLVRSTDRDAPCSIYHCASFFQEPIPSGVPSIVLPLDVGINRIRLAVNIADRVPPPAPFTDSQSYYFTIIRENPPSKPPIELYSSLFSNYRSNDNTIDAVRSVPEKSPAGTPVGARLATTDPYGTLVRYPVYYDFAYSSKFPRKNRAKFDIDNETGQITVAKNANLDHQTEPVIKIEITAYDWKTRDAQGDLVPYFLFPMATITVTINITPSNDPPPPRDDPPPPRDDPPPPRNDPPPPGDPPPKDDGTRVAITERPVTLTEIRNAVYDYNNGRVTLETLLKLLAQFHNRLR